VTPRAAAPGVIAAILLAASAWLVAETRQLAERLGLAERAATDARAAGDAAAAELAAADARAAAAAAAVARLERELIAAQSQIAAMAKIVDERAAEAARSAAERAATAARSQAPMPDGVRHCLRTLHECLQAEGFTTLRFLSARRLDDDGLHDVEVLQTDPDGLGASFVRAARMTAEVDRTAGRFVLRFFDGSRASAGGEPAALPADGLPVGFGPIDGHWFEAKLPFLARGTGAYPAQPGDAAGGRPSLDAAVRRQWLERFDRLLGAGGTAERLRVNRFLDLTDGCFRRAQIVGTDEKNRLVLSASCDRLAVEIDERAGIVSLCLRDGVLFRGGVESTITAEGFRMLLPAVTPEQATSVMLGMVVKK
jgi:hypothetical protein